MFVDELARAFSLRPVMLECVKQHLILSPPKGREQSTLWEEENSITTFVGGDVRRGVKKRRVWISEWLE